MYKLNFCLFFLFFFFSACGQENNNLNYETRNSAVKKINNDAKKVFFDLISSKDTSKTVINKTEQDLYKAIGMDSSYKQSFTNLITCIEIANRPPYKTQLGFLQKQIDVCNLWIAKHPNDKDFRVKRGILHEKNGALNLANVDYQEVLKYLNSKEIKVSSAMDVESIDEAVNCAFLYFIVRRSNEALKIIYELSALYPQNNTVRVGYDILTTSTREEVVFNNKVYN